MIEEQIKKKQIQEVIAQKASLEHQLKKIDQQLTSLVVQKSANPKNLMSHPIFKELVQQEEEERKAQASEFTQKIKHEKQMLNALKLKAKEHSKEKELHE